LGLDIVSRFDNEFEEIMKGNPEIFSSRGDEVPQISLFNDDFLKHDWSECSFVFANSTCFSNELMLELSKKAEELVEGTFFVTFTKRLPCLSENWLTKPGFRRMMSWGYATIYVHRKIK